MAGEAEALQGGAGARGSGWGKWRVCWTLVRHVAGGSVPGRDGVAWRDTGGGGLWCLLFYHGQGIGWR